MLSEHDRTRFVRLLAVASGSAFEGEAVNAVRLAGRLLNDRGVSWDQVISSTGERQHRHQSSSPRRSWRDVVADCLAKPELLTPRESNFLRSMTRWRNHPTPRQRAWFTEIAARLCVPPEAATP